MLKKIILIKLGGSLISDKTAVNKARLDDIDKISTQIKKIGLDNSYSLILSTGAGGFGHPVAKKYINNLKEGKPFIKKAVKDLNNIVVTSLQKTGVKAVSVEPSAITEYRNTQLIYLFDKLIFSWLNNDIIPVFHADLVDDKELGTCILSMDKFMSDLAIHLKQKGFEIETVIFAGSTDGVIDQDGRVIEKITSKDFEKIKKIFYKGKGLDVSGGMKKKVETAVNLSKQGIASYIVQGLKIEEIIINKKISGTKISLD